MPEEAGSFGPIQLGPPGLLSLLRLKNNGRNPEALGRVLYPTMNLLDWYLQFDAEAVGTGSANLAPGAVGIQAFTTNQASLTVPQSEWWYVHAYEVSAQLQAAGEQITYAVAWALPNFTSFRVRGPSTSLAGAATTRLAIANSQGWWMPPGSFMCLYVSVNEGAAAIEVAGNALVTTLPV